ncbi:MAG: hypothetical protein C0506_02635 [Anaerolinea sp.]|nr:hypothetical protein [Anaerolinea sp.]
MTAPDVVQIDSLLTRTPGVYGGRLCLAGTRYPMTQVAVHYREGMTADEIVAEFEGLSLAAVHAAIAYYLANRAAVDAEIEEDTQLYREAAAADRLRQAASAS